MEVIAFKGSAEKEEKIIKIEEDVCKNIEDAHYRYRAYADVEKTYLNDHRSDEDGSAVLSPAFKTYHEQTIGALKDYERKKEDLAEKYNLREYDWSLNFIKCEVKIEN